MPYYVLRLDYDDMSLEDVEEDAKYLKKQFPELGQYKIEQSEGGNHHVSFPKSHLSWEKAISIAESAKVDPDWLEICKKYRVFALFTRDSLGNTLKLRQRKRTYQLEKGTVEGTRLIVIPENDNEHRRVLGICESMKDDVTWTYKTETIMGALKTRIVIGCIDPYQGQRRVKFMRDKCGIKFTEEIL